MSGVIPPDGSQEQVFGKAVLNDGMLYSFLNDSVNVMLLVYGQAGSGKQYTLIGEEDGLKSDSPVSGWGMLPRLVH